jgi:ankyrin repeat protein
MASAGARPPSGAPASDSPTPTPQELVEEELRGAAKAGRLQRVRLLLDRVDDVDGIGCDHPILEGRTAHQLAVLHGNTEIATLLEHAGATPRPLSPVDRLRAACMRPDPTEARRLLSDDRTLAAQLIDACPDLVAAAVELHRIDAIRVLLEIGFDVNPTDRRTPLHEAAFHGDLALVRALIDLGADPSIADPEHHSTPLGWARYNQQHDVAEYLANIP